jgi:phospholipid-binding lipoprotein MlaA
MLLGMIMIVVLGTPWSLGAADNVTTESLSQLVLTVIGSADITFEEDDFAEDAFEMFEDEFQEQGPLVPDPLEPVNRCMFALNDHLYYWVLKPAGKVYIAVMPGTVRTGMRNFFFNLTTPVRWCNCLLQGKGNAAGVELQRFVINSTVGILGIYDPARSELGLEPVEEDLGQTLAVWGLQNGCYLVWPVLGPSTVRDSVGMVGDSFLDPVSYVRPWEVALGISAVEFTNNYSFRLDDYDAFKAEAFEPYIAMREAYVQYRYQEIEK